MTKHPKNAFIDIEENLDSLSWSVAKSLEKLAGYYGPEIFGQLFIMITPCDITTVSTAEFNELIIEGQSQNAGVVLVMAPYNLVKGAFPHKIYQKLYHTDIKQAMASQSIVFVSGEMLRVRPGVSSHDCGLEILDSTGVSIPGMEGMADKLYKGRRGPWLWPNFIYQVFVRRLISNGRGGDVFWLLSDLITRRITARRIGGYLYGALGINFGVVTTRTASFSGDIDSYQDLKSISTPP